MARPFSELYEMLARKEIEKIRQSTEAWSKYKRQLFSAMYDPDYVEVPGNIPGTVKLVKADTVIDALPNYPELEAGE